jgi:hypothetical protein
MPVMPTNSLYRQVLGNDFELLARELQIFHGTTGRIKLSGRCSVTGPQTLLGKLMGWVFALPKTTEETGLLFELDADTMQETWRRHFPNRLMISRMRVVAGTLVERLGPIDLHFGLRAGEGKLAMLLQGISVGGIRCPKFLVPSVLAEETASPGKLHFNVAAQLPIVGLLVAYQGFLNIDLDEVAI